MSQQKRYIYGTTVLLVIVIGLWFMSAKLSGSVFAEQVGIENIEGSGILDGLMFTGQLGPLGKPADINDTFVFKDGMFVSTECEKRCNYPARPYFSRHVGENIEFISETRCPDKDAKIVWRGTIKDGIITGIYTWTNSRWYRTVKKDFGFSGKLTAQSEMIAENR